jgi:transcriptional regulator with XRE-family HTH domain
MESTINQRIENVILALNLTRNSFANRLGVAGSVIYNIVNNRNKPSFDLLEKIISSFDINADYLLTGRGGVFVSKSDIEMNTDFDTETNTDDKKNINYVNVSKKIQPVKMGGDSGGAMGGIYKNNINTHGKDLPGAICDKLHDNSNLDINIGNNDILESNKGFIDGYLHGAYKDLNEYHWEYQQIRYYEPMSIYRLKSIYSAEIEGYKDIYHSHRQLVEILHYLQAAEFLLDKFPVPPDFKEYFKEVTEEWNEDFEGLKDKKLELILKILHVKAGTDDQGALLTKLINYMSMYRDMLLVGKPLK